jgi:hypothetical protein
MRQCRRAKPITVTDIEFAEWTSDDPLRRASFIGLREDKRAHDGGTSGGFYTIYVNISYLL